MIYSVPVAQPTVKFLRNGDQPSFGFVRRVHPIWPEFALKMTWFSEQEWQRNGGEGMVYVWVLKIQNDDYEKPVRRTRTCKSYRGQLRVVA